MYFQKKTVKIVV